MSAAGVKEGAPGHSPKLPLHVTVPRKVRQYLIFLTYFFYQIHI